MFILLTNGLIGKIVTRTTQTIYATLQKEATILSWWSQLAQKSLLKESESCLTSQLMAVTTKKESSRRHNLSMD